MKNSVSPSEYWSPKDVADVVSGYEELAEESENSRRFNRGMLKILAKHIPQVLVAIGGGFLLGGLVTHNAHAAGFDNSDLGHHAGVGHAPHLDFGNTHAGVDKVDLHVAHNRVVPVLDLHAQLIGQPEGLRTSGISDYQAAAEYGMGQMPVSAERSPVDDPTVRTDVLTVLAQQIGIPLTADLGGMNVIRLKLIGDGSMEHHPDGGLTPAIRSLFLVQYAGDEPLNVGKVVVEKGATFFVAEQNPNGEIAGLNNDAEISVSGRAASVDSLQLRTDGSTDLLVGGTPVLQISPDGQELSIFVPHRADTGAKPRIRVIHARMAGINNSVLMTPTATVGSGGEVIDAQPAPTEVTSYLSDLDIVFTSPLQEVKYGNDGPTVSGMTSVDMSASGKGISEVIFNNETMAKVTLRAWMRIIHPELDDNDANLKIFADKLAAVQRGEPGSSCDEVTRTISAYTTDGGGKQNITIAPDCGASVPSEGTVVLGKTNIVFGRWAHTDPATYAETPIDSAPWLDVVVPDGEGAGLVIDKNTRELKLFVSFTDNIENNPSNSVTTGVEVMYKWLASAMQGKELFLNRSEVEYNKGKIWAGGVTVK